MGSKARNNDLSAAFVSSFRNAAPYINAFRARTFILCFGGEVLSEGRFSGLAEDIALLNSLGIRLVLVHGVRPQVEKRLRGRGLAMRYVNGLRITDPAALQCVQEAAGSVRVEIEALLSMGLPSTPLAGAAIRVVSGNFVTARPLGIIDGTDYQHTGRVRRIDHGALRGVLEGGAIALLSPLGYSPTGEVFNLSAQEVAAETAVALGADKLIYFIGDRGLRDGRRRLLRELTVAEAGRVLSGRKLAAEVGEPLRQAHAACRRGVRRAHLIDHRMDGALLVELFTRDGCGTLISADGYEDLRRATVDDVGGIIRLIAPLEEKGVLVRRSRERLEMTIDRFVVVERDGAIVACAALFPFHDEGVGEVACLAVHPDYRNHGYGARLLSFLERQALTMGLARLFVLTTQAIHWFQERGYARKSLSALPVARRALYNYRRGSRVLMKEISGGV
ncbi:MAG TPA: amino-acid N-acetyltransferase [Gammaproteobacteria bacterium]|nr:amino-acid N-acetyltransferase [Gammaproteobacteria bacterium]